MSRFNGGPITLAAIAGLAFLLQCFLSSAATSTEPSRALSSTVSLASLLPGNQRIRLLYTADEFLMFIPMSARLKVNSAVLQLRLTNSTALLRERSQLAVRLNGKVLAQTALMPQRPESGIDIRVPADLLKPGYNQLVFSVVQHYALKCENADSADLWTEIDTVASTLAVEGERLPLTPRLSDMATLFDPKAWGEQALNIITAPAAPVRDDQLQWGALVAQGVALHLRYIPLRVNHTPAVPGARLSSGANFPGLQQDALRRSDSILIGTKDELAPYLAPKLLDGITGGFLGVYPLDADPGRFVLVVSGTTAAEVTQAANAFAYLSFPYPDSASMRVAGVESPTLANYAGQRSLTQGRSYHFSQLDFRTTTVRAAASTSLINEEHIQGMELELMIPGDLFAHEDANVELLLHFAYGAGLRGDSALNIMLNGRFERSIALTVDAGVVYQNYRIAIPLRSLQPGPNRIRFMPRMMPLVTGDCQAVQSENLLMTMYDDSIVRMPSAYHFVSMPNLRLLGRAGFPYTAKPDGAETLVHVAAGDSKTIAAAWTLLAKIAQRHGQPLREAIVSFELPNPDQRNLLVVGPAEKIKPGILKGAPLEAGQVSQAALPGTDAGSPVAGPQNWLARFVGNFGGFDAIAAEGKREITKAAGSKDGALVVQYRSPFAADRTATVFMAADENSLLQGIIEVIKPEIWNDLQGNRVAWRTGADSVTWQKIGGDYSVGKISVPARMEFYFSKYPWIWIVTLLIMTALLAMITTRMLKRYRRRHHPQAPARRGND